MGGRGAEEEGQGVFEGGLRERRVIALVCVPLLDTQDYDR